MQDSSIAVRTAACVQLDSEHMTLANKQFLGKLEVLLIRRLTQIRTEYEVALAALRPQALDCGDDAIVASCHSGNIVEPEFFDDEGIAELEEEIRERYHEQRAAIGSQLHRMEERGVRILDCECGSQITVEQMIASPTRTKCPQCALQSVN